VEKRGDFYPPPFILILFDATDDLKVFRSSARKSRGGGSVLPYKAVLKCFFTIRHIIDEDRYTKEEITS
jgi:hypothetical protein